MNVSVLDTSACAALMRHDPEIEAFLRPLAPGDVALVPPVVAEIVTANLVHFSRIATLKTRKW